MNHFEGRLEREQQNVSTRYFGNDEDAEDYIALHPGEFCCVVRCSKLVSVYYGRDCK